MGGWACFFDCRRAEALFKLRGVQPVVYSAPRHQLFVGALLHHVSMLLSLIHI